MAKASEVLMARLRAGTPDPAADAVAAARDGHFGLVWVRPFGYPAPIGVVCEAPDTGPTQRLPLSSAVVFVSDVIGFGPEYEAEATLTRRAIEYGTAYNHALIAQPNFPYRDLCRRLKQGDQFIQRTFAHPERLSREGGPLTNSTGNLGEAARHGTLAEVRRWLARGGEVNRTDDFDMAPLAWAVVRGRPDVIAALLAAGGDPLAAMEVANDFGPTPFKLALLLRDMGSVKAFMVPTTLNRLLPWPRPLIEAAARTGSADLLARMLKESHERVEAKQLLPLAKEDASGRTLQLLKTFADAKCWKATTPADARLQVIAIHGVDDQAVSVTVEPAAHPVILALSAYNRTHWQIEALPGVKLAGVIVFGYDAGTVSGVGPRTPVLFNDINTACEDFSPGPWPSAPGTNLQQLINKAEAMTGRQTASFQAGYSQKAFVAHASGSEPAPTRP